jgi:hypothetical protein
MKEVAVLTFYKIQKCGYYRHAEKSPELYSPAEMLADLASWVDGKPLQETKTFAPAEGEDLAPVYCYDIVGSSQTGDYVLITWNETYSSEGAVASVAGNEPVGAATVSFTELPEDTIPGYATYFWFIPSKNTLATIRFGNRYNGHRALIHYLNEFLAKFTTHAVHDKNGQDDLNIVGYRKPGETAPPQHLEPYFQSTLLRSSGQLERIRKERQRIGKIIRKNLLRIDRPKTRTLFNKMMVNLGLKDTPVLSDDIRARYEVNYTPSADELDSIISTWEASHDTKWDDVGFKLSNSGEIVWLSHSVIKLEPELDIERANEEIVKAASLLSALERARLGLLKDI